MVKMLADGAFDSTRPRASIETTLHGFLPYKNIDHHHSDAVISIACTANWQDHARKVWGDTFVAAPFQRPGFALSKQISAAVAANPNAKVVVMQSHGGITWHDGTSQECYEHTLQVLLEAEGYVHAAVEAKNPLGNVVVTPMTPDHRREVQLAVAPYLRGLISKFGHQILQFDDSLEILDWVGRERFFEVAGKGAPCPDHLPHVKHWPALVNWKPTDGIDKLKEALKKAIDAYVEKYTAYFEKNKVEGDKMLNPMPRVILIPGLGMFTCGQDIGAARISREIYYRAIPVITGAEALGGFIPLSDKDAYDIEYWPLELYKATLKPKPKKSAGRVAFVTGGASGIGRATCYELASEDCCVLVADYDFEGAKVVAEEIEKRHGAGRALAVKVDVSDEAQVQQAINAAVSQWGGIDYVLNNAGVTRAAALHDVTKSHMDFHYNVMFAGYLWVSKLAEEVWKLQAIGGSMVLTLSKNSSVATPGAIVYNSLKAAQQHMMHCLALELAPLGVRVNGVRPDAVIQGSGIWNKPDERGVTWIAQRAEARGTTVDGVAKVYIDKSLLKVEVLPEHVSAANCWLLSDAAGVTSGCEINVDGGNFLHRG